MIREGVVIFTGALAKHLAKVCRKFFSFSSVSSSVAKILFRFFHFFNFLSFCGQDDAKVHDVVEKLLDVLNTPSEAVQRAVSDCLSPLMVAEQVWCSHQVLFF